jgi:hypothetical protein
MTPAPIPSRKVRRILAFEARARRLITRYERALDKAVRAKAEAHRALDQARSIESTLNGGQLGELQRGRAERGARPAHPDATAATPDRSTTTPQ